MITQQKICAMKILKRELEQVQNSKFLRNFGITAGLIKPDDPFKWQCTLSGGNDTPYAGGLFFLIIEFPDNYPSHGPIIRFKNKIYHMNVEKNGGVYPSIINNWNPDTSIEEVLSHIYLYFYKANPENAITRSMAEEFLVDRELYNNKIKDYTKKYASIKNDY